jgi:hypothetical protein
MTPLLLLLLAATAATPAAAPTKAEFKAAWQAMAPEPDLKLRKLACKSSPQEPTEYACTFEKKVSGQWQKWSTIVARDGQRWTLIDRPGPAAR